MPLKNINIQMDENLQKQADELFADLGLNMATAVNIFVRQSVRYGGIPFEIVREEPNEETIAAFQEGEEILKSKERRFSNCDEMFQDLGI